MKTQSNIKQIDGGEYIHLVAVANHTELVQRRIEMYGNRMQSNLKTICQIADEQQVIQDQYTSRGGF